MSEKKHWLPEWIKELLDWLHDAYWIRNFIISVGWTGTATQSIAKHIPAIAEYKWWIFILLTGISMYAWAAIRKTNLDKANNDKPT